MTLRIKFIRPAPKERFCKNRKIYDMLDGVSSEKALHVDCGVRRSPQKTRNAIYQWLRKYRPEEKFSINIEDSSIYIRLKQDQTS